MTYGLEGRCSIQLSYWRSTADRDGRIRTGDPSLPKRVLYRAEPRPAETTKAMIYPAGRQPRLR